jgi:hypothetical protein
MKLAVLTGLVVFAMAGSAGAGGVGQKPALRLVDRTPVTVVGVQFTPGERVLVRVESARTWTRRATAKTSGTFRVVLQSATVSRCEALRVIAIGSRGSRAILKLLPPPACNPL